MKCNTESICLEKYESALKSMHEQMNIQLLGLAINPLHTHVGASSGGIHKCACHGDVLLKIKCPFVHRYKTIDEITAADKDGKFIIQPDRTVNKSHPYNSQAQLQMYLCGAVSCDLVVHKTLKQNYLPSTQHYGVLAKLLNQDK